MNTGHTTTNALKFLLKQQQPNGGFASISSPDPLKFARPTKRQTTFVPSLIYLALTGVSSPVAGTIKSRTATFLLNQKSPQWSFNYWDRTSQEYTDLPYPDDLDDTFLALSALWYHDSSLFDGKVMARIAGLLVATESRTGGPYRTWLVNDQAPKIWRDVDVAVNANISYFLSLQQVVLPNVSRLLLRSIRQELKSSYYPDVFPTAYFISRSQTEPAGQQALRTLILNYQQAGKWGNPLQTALAICTILHSGGTTKDLPAAIDYLTATQRPSGSWPAQAFCIDPAQHAVTNYGGAEALTTAICLEALTLYEQANKLPILVKKAAKPVNRHYQAVKKNIGSAIAALGQADLERHTTTIFKRILRQDEDGQILMLPWVISNASGLTVPEAILQQLAQASVWGWMAYTTYDDFLDGEGEPLLLPSANVCLRSLVNILTDTLPDSRDFQAEVKTIMNRLDAANAWEVSHCRGRLEKGRLYLDTLPDYGDYWQLADRSLGHTIAGLGVMYTAGYSQDSADMIALRDFFRHYLIARQLNDDAHDWYEDLLAGHVNAVAVQILQTWLFQGHSLKKGIDLFKQKDTLQGIMWEKVITDTCSQIHYHTRAARGALQRGTLHWDITLLAKLLTPLEAAADLALDGQRQAAAFIRAL